MPHLGADGTIGDVGGLVGDVVLKLHLDLEMIVFAATRVQPVDDLHHHGIVFLWGGIVILVGKRATIFLPIDPRLPTCLRWDDMGRKARQDMAAEL